MVSCAGLSSIFVKAEGICCEEAQRRTLVPVCQLSVVPEVSQDAWCVSGLL